MLPPPMAAPSRGGKLERQALVAANVQAAVIGRVEGRSAVEGIIVGWFMMRIFCVTFRGTKRAYSIMRLEQK